MTSARVLNRFGHYLIAFALLAVAVAANVASALDQSLRAGKAVALRGLFLDEITSAVVWLALVPLIVGAFRLSARSRMPTGLFVHIALAPAVSLVHFVMTRILRALSYAGLNEGFVFRFVWSDYVADLYKDVLTYLLLGLICWGTQRLLTRQTLQPEPTRDSAASPTLEVRDGAKTTYIAVQDILWVEAASNYVELYLSGGQKRLMRSTLAGVASRLSEAGFQRVHRSRLVNIAAITAIHNRPAGEAVLHLSDGTAIPVSRSYRSMVASTLADRAAKS